MSHLSQSQVSVSDRGLLYGHGAFETVTVHKGVPLFLDYHLDRLCDALNRLFIPLSRECLNAALLSELPFLASGTVSDTVSGIVKIIVTAGQGERGYSPPSVMHPSIIVQWFPSSAPALMRSLDPISVLLSSVRLADQPMLAGMKHLNRLEQVMAAAELGRFQSEAQSGLKDELTEGVLRDQNGFIIEGIMSNIILLEPLKGANRTIENDAVQLVTPKLDRCGVSGVLRRVLLEEAEQIGYNVVETDVDWQRLEAASALLMTNVSQGMRRVARMFSADITKRAPLLEWRYDKEEVSHRLWQQLQQRIQRECTHSYTEMDNR